MRHSNDPPSAALRVAPDARRAPPASPPQPAPPGRRPWLAVLAAALLGCGGGAGAPADALGLADATDGVTSADTAPTDAVGGGDAADADALAPPPGLVRYLTGSDADADAAPAGPALLLMGGGPDVDDAVRAWLAHASGGDVVVLRASGADGYNPYLYAELGVAVDSVETLLVDTRALAADPWVAARVASAEAIFVAGGDQAVYVEAWAGSPLAAAVQHAWERGAALGGSSAGLAILGEHVYSAANGTVYSDEALADPYVAYVTLAPALFDLPPLRGVVTDSHFRERDRMGRLLAFVARLMEDGTEATPVGVGIDEATAVVVTPGGEGTVYGEGAVYVLGPSRPPTMCAPGQALVIDAVALTKLVAGDRVSLPSWATAAAPAPLAASGGETAPPHPY